MDNDKKEETTEVVEAAVDTEDAVKETESIDNEQKEEQKTNGAQRPNYQPYDERTQVKRTTSDDQGAIALTLGIIAIVASLTGILSLVGLVCGIIAVVKGSKVRKISSSGMAGWVLGIIAVVFSGVALFAGMALLSQFMLYSRYMMF